MKEQKESNKASPQDQNNQPPASINVQSRLNKQDIQNIERRLGCIEEEVGDTPTKEDFNNLQKTVNKVLLEGNGSKPLTVQVAKNRSKIQNIGKRISRIYKAGFGIISWVGYLTTELILKNYF